MSTSENNKNYNTKEQGREEQGEKPVEVPIYTRDELVYLAKLYERAERYEEAVEFSTEFIKLKPILNSDERIIFGNSFKSLLVIKRNSLRYLTDLLSKQSSPNSSKIKDFTKTEQQKSHIEEIIFTVEEEYFDLIDSMIDILENLLIPNSKKPEAQVYYLKLKGDYNRYKLEYFNKRYFFNINSNTPGLREKDLEKEFENEREALIEITEQAYNDAYTLAEDELHITSINRISLALNYSLFFYEMKYAIDEAILIAKNCCDEALKVIDEVDQSYAKDYYIITQILKENIIFWTNEKGDDEEN